MTPYATGAVLMIASGSIHAVVNAIVKGGRDKAAGRAITDATGAIILLPALFLVPWPAGAWGWLAASAVLHAIYLYALVRAYGVGDLSAVYPVLRGTAPLITAGVSIGVLGEHATRGQIAGIAAIGAAMFVMVSGKHIGRAALAVRGPQLGDDRFELLVGDRLLDQPIRLGLERLGELECQPEGVPACPM